MVKSVQEAKAGKVEHGTKVVPNQIAAARLKTGLSQIQIAFTHPKIIRERLEIRG